MIKTLILSFAIMLYSGVTAQNDYGMLKGAFYNQTINNLHNDSVQVVITKTQSNEEIYNTKTLQKFRFQLAPGLYNLIYYLDPNSPIKISNIKVSIHAITIMNIDIQNSTQD